MIHSNPGASVVHGSARLAEMASRLARRAEGLVSWIGFFLLCLFVGGDEVRRQAGKRSRRLEVDG
jgi:hypothetical protein